MLSIGGIIPSWRYWANPMKIQPLWDLYYATLIAERIPDASVDLTDLRLPDFKDNSAGIPERDIYLHWIMRTADAPEVYGIVQELRETYPKAVHIAGGTHVDNCAYECEKIFDACIHGTGEELLVSAIEDFRNKDMKRSYRSSLSFPFADYSFARRDFIPSSSVVNYEHFAQYEEVLGTGVYFSRGCGFKCKFCVYNWPPKFDFRTPAQIKSELEYLKQEYNIGAVILKDEVCIPVNKSLARPYLEAIGSAGIKWRGQTVPLASEELVSLAKDSGCVELTIGLESVESDKVLEIANSRKNPSVENGRRFIELLKKYGIKVRANLILGLPGESKDVAKNTIKYLEEVDPDYVSVSGFDPVPGSEFYENYAEYGIDYIGEDLSKHAHLLYRFGDEEDVGLPFEYKSMTSWGEALTRDEIIAAIQEVQHYLREHGKTY